MDPRLVTMLGLVTIVFASLLFSTLAYAIDHTFNSEAEVTALTGDDDGGSHTLQVGSASINCATVTLASSQIGKEVDTATLVPTHSECKIGSTSISLSNEGCSLEFDSDTAADPGTGGESASVSMKCEPGKFTKLMGPGCTIDFSSQGPLYGIRFHNSGSGSERYVTMEVHVFGIRFNATNAGCALLGIKQGESMNGTYLGNGTVKGFVAGNPHGARVGVFYSTP